MRPWQHARSSAHGGASWDDILEVHEFLDLSKTACADRRHRIVLHHVDLGLAIAEQAFSLRTDVAILVRQHVKEDLGSLATLSDWLGLTDVERLPSPVMRRIGNGPAGIAALVANRLHASQAADVEKVSTLLFAPADYHPPHPEQALAVLMNSVGPAIVRRAFGPPVVRQVGRQRVVTDWGWIAEAVIMACFGRIPALSEIVDCVGSEPVAIEKARNRPICR